MATTNKSDQSLTLLSHFFTSLPSGSTIVTIETKEGDVIRGTFDSTDNNFNVTLLDVTTTKVRPERVTNKSKKNNNNSSSSDKSGSQPDQTSAVTSLPVFVVAGKHIRNINFDEYIAVSEVVEKERIRLEQAKLADKKRYDTKRAAPPQPERKRIRVEKVMVRHYE